MHRATDCAQHFMKWEMFVVSLLDLVLTLTLVGMKLCMLHHKSAILLYIGDLPMLQYTLFPWKTILGRRYGCGIAMYESFVVHPQLCFVVSFVLRVPGLEEGAMFGVKALG